MITSENPKYGAPKEVTIIVSAHTRLVPDTAIQATMEDAALLLCELPITHISVIEYAHARHLIVDYDSMLVGSRVTFTEKTR